MTVEIKPQSGLKLIPPYKPGRSIDEIQRLYHIQDVIKLASNENPLGPSPKALLALQNAIHKVNFYPDGQNYALRESLAKKLGVPIEMVIVGNGEDGLILETCMAYLSEDSEVIVSQSSFPVYDIYTLAMRSALVKAPLENFTLDLQEMAAAVTEKTKMIFVCNPNNPTGTVVTKPAVDLFLKSIPDHILVIFDEAYFEYVEESDFPDTLEYIHDGRENILLLRTFSKVYGLAGLRLGYGVGSKSVLAPLNAIKEPFSVNLLAQIAGTAALDDSAFLEKTLDLNRNGKNYLYQEFKRLGIGFVRSSTNFILVDLGSESLGIIEKLTQKGVIIRPCSAYNLPGFARISIGDTDQNKRFINSLDEVLHD
jgi:histidinol-phosphate aminotransferase